MAGREAAARDGGVPERELPEGGAAWGPGDSRGVRGGAAAEVWDGVPDPPAPGARPLPPAPPVHRLTVLHDPGCPLCRHLSEWLRRQPQYVPLEFVAVGSDEAGRRFPGVDRAAAYREITVIADGGQVWTGHHAFVTCLWALREYRPLAHRLSTPAGLPFARGAALAAAKYRAVTRGPGAGPAPGTAGHRPGWSVAPGPGRGPNPFAPALPPPPAGVETADAPGCDGRCDVPGRGLA